MTPAPVLTSFVLAARPKTLPAAIAPVWVGCAYAASAHAVFSPLLAACTMASAIAIQIGCNLFNDAIDFQKGADTDRRVGPVRVTASGLVPPRTVILWAVTALLLACLFALPMIWARGWPLLAIGLPSLYFAFGYTGGPFPLAYRGMGEIFVLLFFGLVAVPGTVFVQTGHWDAWALLAGFQIGCLSTALIAVNNLRDRAEDSLTGKRTFAVRFGERAAKNAVAVWLLAPILVGPLWLASPLPALGWIPLAALPIAILLARSVWQSPPGPANNRHLARAAGLLVLWAVLFQIACLIPAR